MIFALLISAACALLGYCLGRLDQLAKGSVSRLEESIEDLLPGIECGQCGYPGCKPYAAAIAAGEASIALCPPGGATLMQGLSDLLNQDLPPAPPEEGPAAFTQVAFINEADCVGCTLCVPPCPFDAIVGTPQAMHTVVMKYCTGCELCLPACPVDCISLRPIIGGTPLTRESGV